MTNSDDIIVVYNMGNFHTGKVACTHDKGAKKAYEDAGYKLISTVFVTVMQYLNNGGKK